MFRLFKKKYVYPELKWPSYAREMTEYEKRFVVNGGAMTPEDQYNIAEAYRTGDQGKVDEIMSHYQNSGSGTTNTTPPSTTGTTPTTTTPPASVPTTPPANTTPSSSSSNNNGSGGFSGGGSGSSGGGSGSGGSSGSGSGSGSGGNSSPSSTSTTTTSQHKPSVSEQEGYLKAGLSHVEDYKKAARKTLGIRGSSVTGSSFKGKEVKGWRNNGDGTHTVTAEGATLWDRYGPNWRELSHYEGDPTKLHVGDTVGKKIKVNPGAGEMTVTERVELAKKNGNNKFLNTNSGYEIDHDSKTIRTSFGDKSALRDAIEKFMAYDMEGYGYTFEAYCANGSCKTYSKFSDLWAEMHPKGDPIEVDEALYKNEYIRVASVKGGYNLSDTTPWEIEASALEFNTSGTLSFIDVNSSYQALNLEGNISYGSISNPGLSIAAKASLLDFEGEVSFHALGYKIDVTPNISIGSIGGELTFEPNGFKTGLAIGIGGGIGVNWNRE